MAASLPASAQSPTAFVLGGGVAGLAAAFGLLERGYRVELWEARGWLGGRVFSLAGGAGEDGGGYDNGPHVMLGCYEHMRALLRRLGTEDAFDRASTLRLSYRSSGGMTSALQLGRAPVPLALPAKLVRLPGLSPRERLRGLRGLCEVLRGAPAQWTLEQWVRARGQDGGPRRYLWDPLCLTIMNASAAEVSARLFLTTLRRAFCGSAAAAAIWTPLQPWHAIVGDPAGRALRAAGAEVRTRCTVRGLEIAGGAVRALHPAGGPARHLAARDLIVAALPSQRLARVLPPSHAAGMPNLAPRAILTAYFDLDDGCAPPDEGTVTVLVDGAPFQILYRTPGARRGRFALIASCADGLAGTSAAAIAALARAQLAACYPGLALPAGTRPRLVKEPRATFLAAPGLERPAPGAWPRLANLLVCGDWVATGLPATLEGAALSGVRVAASAPAP